MTGQLMWAQTEDPGPEQEAVQGNQTGQCRHDQQGSSASLRMLVGTEAQGRRVEQEKLGSLEKLQTSEAEKLHWKTTRNSEQRSIRSLGEYWKSEEKL